MLTIAELPERLRDKVHRELERGERVLWLDTAVPRLFDNASLGMVLISVPWTAFAVYWMYLAGSGEKQGGFRYFYLFGLPFVLIGLGMMISPLWVYLRTSWTAYLLTSRRAIVIEYGWNSIVRSFLPQEIGLIFRKDLRDGTGDVILGRREWRDTEGETKGEDLGFLGVREPQEVERQVRRWIEDFRSNKKVGEPSA